MSKKRPRSFKDSGECFQRRYKKLILEDLRSSESDVLIHNTNGSDFRNNEISQVIIYL